MLPSGPRWMTQVIKTTHPTKSPVVLYWHDPLDCIASILSYPCFHDQLDFTSHKVYTMVQQQCRVYSEWMTGDDAWKMQVRIFSSFAQGSCSTHCLRHSQLYHEVRLCLGPFYRPTR
jgi:hypothetical protein